MMPRLRSSPWVASNVPSGSTKGEVTIAVTTGSFEFLYFIKCRTKIGLSATVRSSPSASLW